jgi:hypothetical protein
MATLSKIATVLAVLALARLDGRVFQYGGIPSVFSGGGLVSALLSFSWPASTISSPQIVLLAGLLLVAAMHADGRIGVLASARLRTLTVVRRDTAIGMSRSRDDVTGT